MSEAPEGGGVLVTFRDMYVELRGLTGELRQVSGDLRAGALQAADHEARIRALERWRYTLPASLVLAVGSTAVALVSLFTHH